MTAKKQDNIFACFDKYSMFQDGKKHMKSKQYRFIWLGDVFILVPILILMGL